MEDKILQEEIRQAIEKNLPTQVGEILKKTLIDYELLQSRHKQALGEIGKQSERIERLIVQVTEINVLKKRELDVEHREDACFEKEMKLELTISRKDKDCAEAKVGLMQENFNTVFRNVDIVRNKIGVTPVVHKNQDGSTWTISENSTVNETETKT